MLGLVAAALALATTQPGWREVGLADLKAAGGASARFRSGPPSLRAAGDFDGDRKRDEAVLVRNDARSRYAVEVRLATGKRFHLAEGDLRQIADVSLATVLRGRYRTACGKGYGACGKGEASEVVLRQAGIEVSYFEKASALYYWTGKGFAEVWTSD